jgi:hypothetical protein
MILRTVLLGCCVVAGPLIWATSDLWIDKSTYYKPVPEAQKSERIVALVVALGCEEKFNMHPGRHDQFAEMLRLETVSLASQVGTDVAQVMLGMLSVQAVTQLGNDCQVKEDQLWNSVTTN